MPRKTGGFLLLEAAPALLLLALFLMAVARAHWLGTAFASAGRHDLQRERMAAAVWQRWAETGGRAALARVTETGIEVFDFPDTGWLPEGFPAAEDGLATAQWRRRLEALPDGTAFWDVEVRTPGGSGWAWCMRVADRALPEAAP